MIAITLESDTVMAGHFLPAQIRWSCDGPHAAHRILVSAEWQSKAFNGTRRGVGRSMQHVPSAGERGGTFPAHLLIPHEGPVSFAGQLITIEWTLWARIDRPGADEFTHLEFRVVPRRVT